jgi:hypothetical protein
VTENPANLEISILIVVWLQLSSFKLQVPLSEGHVAQYKL